jgi:AcrR family transcriptional regulator
MRQIAERAEVAVETVYLHFRPKSALLTTLLDLAHGSREGLPVAQRDWVRQVHAQQDATGKVDTAVANLAAVYGSLVPLYLAVRAAVDANPAPSNCRTPAPPNGGPDWNPASNRSAGC